MTFQDLDDLLAHWVKFPPAHRAIRRLEVLLRVWMGIDPADGEGVTSGPQPRPPHPTEQEVRWFVQAANAQPGSV